MVFEGGNKAIRDHVKDGKVLYLFETLGKGQYRCQGEFVCSEYYQGPSTSAKRKELQDIIFQLTPVSLVENTEEDGPPSPKMDLAALRQLALDASGAATKLPLGSKSCAFKRAKAVSAYVCARAEGICECCGKPAPFVRSNGAPFLEAHHIRKLSDNGVDHPQHVAAVCPNCHRAAHYSGDHVDINVRLAAAVAQKETSLSVNKATEAEG